MLVDIAKTRVLDKEFGEVKLALLHGRRNRGARGALGLPFFRI